MPYKKELTLEERVELLETKIKGLELIVDKIRSHTNYEGSRFF